MRKRERELLSWCVVLDVFNLVGKEGVSLFIVLYIFEILIVNWEFGYILFLFFGIRYNIDIRFVFLNRVFI